MNPCRYRLFLLADRPDALYMFLFFQAEKAKAIKASAGDKIKTLLRGVRPILHCKAFLHFSLCISTVPQKIRFVNTFLRCLHGFTARERSIQCIGRPFAVSV
jgi:hypothetical protein